MGWPDASGLSERRRQPRTRADRRRAKDNARARQERRRRDRQAERRVRLDTHRWTGVGGGTVARCVDCPAWRGNGAATTDVQACTGTAPQWRQCLEQARRNGHLVQQGLLHEEGMGNAGRLMLCVKCGVYTPGIKAVGLG